MMIKMRAEAVKCADNKPTRAAKSRIGDSVTCEATLDPYLI